jgi:hypothetical protein
MTAQKAVEILKQWKAVYLIGATAAGALLAGAALPGQVKKNTATIHRLESSQDSLGRRVGSLETGQDYLICLSEAGQGLGTRTPIQCANDRIRARP